MIGSLGIHKLEYMELEMLTLNLQILTDISCKIFLHCHVGETLDTMVMFRYLEMLKPIYNLKKLMDVRELPFT